MPRISRRPPAPPPEGRGTPSATRATRPQNVLQRVLPDHLEAAVARAGTDLQGAANQAFQKLTQALPSRTELWERLAGKDSAGSIGWAKREGPPTLDATARFDEVYAQARAGALPVPADADRYTYLLVPGLFTERFPGYMSSNVKVLQELGLDARQVELDTDASVETNAKVVRDAILDAARSGKQVVLMGQSKGGVDTAAALAMYPELRPHVRSFVAMQAPYGGSPVAHDLAHCPELVKPLRKVVEQLFEGDVRALSDLAYDRRRAFVARHPYPTEVPTLSLATHRKDAGSVTLPAAAYIQHRYGVQSDGLVAAADAEIPGSHVVRLEGMDHAESVMVGVPHVRKHHPADVTRALLTMALSLPEPRR